ncbi:MAG TPA: cytochrome C [Burkholderiales bacterium]|nr:cytochrome C [Burkholderiales bacterium]
MKVLLACSLLAVSLSAAAQQAQKSDPSIARGRYVIAIAGCNDCHTPHYPQTGGKVAESEWLTGDALGWRGPWGTTYATNLRLYMQEITEEQWVKKAQRLNARPPMPWFNLHHMSKADLRAIYRYVQHLGPAGKPAPAYVPPQQKPAGPYVQFPE